MTYREYLLKIEGYNREQSGINNRFRLLVYSTIKPYLKDQDLSVYEFMPLPDDPTPDEIEIMQQQEKGKAMAEAREIRDRILAQHKQRNGRV